MNSFKGGFNLSDRVFYPLYEGKNTLKSFYEYNYVIPRCADMPKEVREFLEKNSFVLTEEEHANGENGYIVFRPKKKLTKEQVEIIKNDTGSYRAKAKKYNLSLGTISKIMNDKY